MLHQAQPVPPAPWELGGPPAPTTLGCPTGRLKRFFAKIHRKLDFQMPRGPPGSPPCPIAPPKRAGVHSFPKAGPPLHAQNTNYPANCPRCNTEVWTPTQHPPKGPSPNVRWGGLGAWGLFAPPSLVWAPATPTHVPKPTTLPHPQGGLSLGPSRGRVVGNGAPWAPPPTPPARPKTVGPPHGPRGGLTGPAPARLWPGARPKPNCPTFNGTDCMQICNLNQHLQ